ncbi:hypothetical protein [Agromyces sp. Soil535]|uniref:hypothetical protein n=1 Tax=Agromyces sp. Soil535 TaxID=1736390 RepID=UPI0006FCC5C1|nr:hypothetical protein [Agromyces sp. Soil535]KRE30965.1 hypothetical protein ASG80_00185 [Agromyces sp. Soil535]
MSGELHDTHSDMHSEQGALRDEHPGRSRNPIIKVAGAVAAVVRPDFTVAIAGSDPERMVARLPGLASMRTVADRAQAQGCGRRRPVDAVSRAPATSECSILQD